MLDRTRYSKEFRIGVTLILLMGGFLPACRSKPTLTPIPALYHVQQGDAALLDSDFATAEDAYRQAAQVDPDCTPAYSHLAFLYSLQPERWSESLQLAEQAVSMAPDDSAAWAYLSLVRMTNYHYDQLAEAAQKAVELDEENALAHVALGCAQGVLNEVEKARTELERALELEPENVLALIAQAAYYGDQGKFDQALLSAEKAVAVEPDFVPARLALAYAHMDVLEYQEAREQLEKALGTAPEYLPAILAMVQLCATQDQMDEAQEEMQRAEELAPNVPDVLIRKGQLDLMQENYGPALRHFSQAVSLDQALWRGYLGKGLAYAAIYEVEKAIDEFSHVLDLYPGSGLAHLWLALSLEQIGESERAEEGYRRAAELSPYDPNVLLGVAGHKLWIGEYEQAMDAYHTALTQKVDEAETYVTLGRVHLFWLRNPDAAEGNFLQALALEPDNLYALTGLGLAYNDRQEYEEAVEILDQVFQTDRHSIDACYGLGVAHAMQGKYREAIADLQRLLYLEGTEHVDAYLYLGRAYREVGRYQDAAEAFNTYLQLGYFVLSPPATEMMAESLAEGEYELVEADALVTLREGMEFGLAYFEDLASLLSAEVETLDGQRTLKTVIEVEEEIDDEALTVLIFAVLRGGVALVPRVQPPLDGGMLIVMRDTAGQDIVEMHIPREMTQDILDGLLSDYAELLQGISLKDLRRWDPDLSLEDFPAQVGETVEEDRNLVAIQEVEFYLMTPAELRARIEEEFQETDAEELDAYQDLLVLLGLLEPDLDLRQTLIDLESSPTPGFYDRQEDVLYVLVAEDELNVEDELTFAHEYVHALQDQHHDLSILEDQETTNSDQRLAFLALIEGEAMQVTYKYFEQHLTTLEQMTVIMQWEQLRGEVPEDIPPIITSFQIFPYQAGLQFVETIAPRGYWPAIDRLYEDLPASTEQIMHPEKYQEEWDEPQEVTLPQTLSQLEADWEEMGSEVMGEFFTREYLAGHVSPDLAKVAAAGWDGDRYAFFENREDDRDLLIWKTVWDSMEDAREFVMAHRLAFREDAGYQETLRELRGGDRTLRWEGDERCVYLRQQGDTTWLVYTSRPEDLDTAIPLLDQKPGRHSKNVPTDQ